MNDMTRILIVEDQSSDYELAQREIRKAISNCQFQRVEKEAEFLQALQEFQPDVILSDYKLPQFDGMKVLELVQQQDPSMTVIIWTGAMSEDVAVECMRNGASNYVIKDNIKRLGPAVSHALKEREEILERERAEEKFQAIFENSPVGIFQSTPQGRFISVNASMARIYGYASPQEMIESITNIASQIYIASRDRNQFTQLLQMNASVENFEMKNVRKDGSMFWTSTSARAVRDESGNVLYYEGFLQDITDRKLTEEKLQESEARYHGIFENVQDAIFVETLEGDILEVNQRACEMFGYTRQEFLHKKVIDIVPSKESIVYIPEANSFPGQTFETINIRANGEHFPVEISGGLYEFGDRSLFLIILRDVTERTESEQQLRQQEQRFRALIENGMDNISLLARDGTLLWENPAVNNTLGYLSDEFVNHNIFKLMHPDDMAWTSELFAKVIREPGSQQHGTFRLRRQDGKWRWMEATATNMLDEPSVNAVVINYRDITERKNTEEALREERNLLRTLIDNLPDRIYAMDKQGKKTLANIADLRAAGKETMEDIVGKTEFDLYPPELAEPFWQADKAILDSGQPLINLEEPGLDFEGNPVSILTTKIPLHDEEGHVIGLVGVGRDITERKQAEARINDLLSLNEKILNHSPLGILTYKLSGECVFANENAASIIGTNIENLMLQNFHWIESWKKSGLYDLVQKAIATKSTASGDIHHISTFGKDIWMTVHCVTFTSNKEEHVLLSILDVTERKQAEEKLLQSRQELTEAQRVAKIGSWSFDLLQNKVHWSDELYRIFGIDQNDFAHTYEAFLEHVHPDDRQKAKQRNSDAIEKGSSFEAEYRIITSTNQIKTISEIGYAVRAEDGQIVSLFGTAQDITQRKRTEAERQALFEIMQGLAITNDLQEFLKLIHVTIGKVIYAENFFVVLHHTDTGLFEEIYSVDQYDPPAPPSHLEKSITSYVFRLGEPLLLKEDSFNELASQGEVELIGAPSASWLGAPLKTSNGTIGVIVVQDYQDANRYSEHDKDFLASIATQVALAVERKQAEKALKESTAQLRTLFEASPDAVMLIDPHTGWTIIDCNSVACKINGYLREELIGKPVDILNTERSTPESHAAYFKRIQETDVYRYETSHVHKNGTIFPIEVSTSLIRLGDRDLVLGIDRDITERKRSEVAEREQRILAEALRDTSEILSSSLDYGEVLDHILAAAGRVVPHDAATIMLIEDRFAHVVRLQGYKKRASNDEIMGVRLSLAETTNLRAMLETRQPVVVNDTHTYAGWKRMESTDWLRSNVGAPISIDGNVIGFILLDSQTPEFFTALHAERLQAFANQAAVAIHNAHLLQQAQNEITERKRVEQALQAEQEKVRTYLDIAGVIMLALDQNGTVTLINQKGCEILGFSAEEIIGKHWITTFLPDGIRDEMEEVFQQFISGNAELLGYYENAVLCRDGKERLIAWHNTLVRDKQGTIINSLSSGEDITERKQAEGELRASEERFQQLADNIPEVFWMTNAQTGQELYASPASEKVWGRSEEYFLREPNAFLKSVFSDDLPMVLHNLEKEKNGENVEMEYRIVHPDGSIHWIWDRAFPIFDESGKVRTLAGIAADVTERKQAELRLQQSQARYYSLFDSSPISLWEENYSLVKKRVESLQRAGITDLNVYLSAHPNVVLELASLVRVIDVNQASVQLYHAEDKKALLTNLPDFISEATLLHFQDEIIGLMRPEARFTWEGKDKTLDGRELTVMVNGSIAPGYEQTWSKVIVSISDITERKQAEEALRESEARFGNAFEFAPIGIALVALDGKWIKVNQVLCELFGYTEHELITKTFQEITHPDDLNTDLHFLEQTIRGKMISYQMEKRYFHKSGSTVWALLSVSLVRDNEGKPQYFISQIQDITERKQAQEEIERRARETSALLETSLALTNLDLKAILQTVGNSAKSIFAADGCRVFLMQPDGKTLRCVLALQENAALLSNLKVKLGEGVTGAVAVSGKAEIINNMQDDPRSVQIPGTPEEEPEAIMFAPLKERDRTLGVLSIRRASADHPFQSADLELLEAFASMAASAVSNARFFEEAQQRLAELEAIYENGLAVGQLLEQREIGNRIIETFASYLSWHHVTIRLLRSETDELEVIAFNLPGLNEDQKIEMEHHFNQMVSRTGQGLSGWVVQTGTPLRTGNVHANPHYVDAQAGIQSGLYMPLKIGGRIIGVISVESELQDAFTEQDERLLATLASQAAVAFENARLYQTAHQELLERTRAQAALWASENHYRELADSITDILFELDYNLTYTHWNKASEMFSGVPAEDAIGKTMQEVWERSAEQLGREEIYRNVLKERQARILETTVFPRGQKRVLEIHAYPSTRGVSVVARDITDRKLDETLTQKRVELMEYSVHHSLEELMQETIDKVCVLTDSHIGFLHFVEEDQETLSLQAWSSETIHERGKIHEQGMHYPIDSAGVWADAVRQRQSLIHNDYESLLNKKWLPENHVKVNRELIIPIIRDERVVAVMGVGNKTQEYTQHDLEVTERFADYAWDIIERRQMEAALADERNQLAKRVEERTADLSRANSNLARALRVKDEFLANMSHELRTPLNAILGLSESLSEQVAGPLNEKQQKYLSTINESGHHLLSLINDILDLAKIEAGQITLDINKVDVNSVCQASLRMIKQLAQKKNQEVLFDIDSDVGLMWADERRLKQMIVNLLSNAVKFTPESGQLGLEVHGDEEANRVFITVWDKGIGISNQDMERLFKPFVQLDSGLAREATGTGLGLALVAQMARLHGGSVSVESQVGGGSRFTILLPWEPALAVDASTRLRNTGKFRAIDPNATNQPTILLIEDTREVVMMLVDYLQMSGFKMITAQDGTDGIQQAKLFHPNLILMDVMMPGMDGFETTRRLRLDSQFKDTPIIALTALAMPSDRQRCLDAGMDEYISKPVNLKALVKLIQSILLEKEDTKSK